MESVNRAKQEIESECRKNVLDEELKGSNYDIINKLTDDKVIFITYSVDI